MRLTWVVVMATSVGWACAGNRLDQPLAQFPSKEELRQIAARRAHPVPLVEATPADRWQIETPVPAPSAPYPTETVWDRMLLDIRSRHPTSARLAPELRCAATETARFYVQNGAYPEDALRKYLLLRCGSTLASASLRMLSSNGPDNAPDAQVEANLTPSARELIDRQLSSGTEMGLGFARGNGRASIVAFSGTPLGRVRDVPAIVDGSRVTLDGEVAFDTTVVLGLASQGDLGVALCENDGSVKLPAFRLSCPLATGDLQTRIDIVARKPSQVLLRPGTQLMVRRTRDAGLVYEAHVYGSREPAANAEAFRKTLVEGLNEARARAGLRPLQVEANESHDSDELVGRFFESAMGGRDSDADTVALGLLAGWDVAGMIRDAGVYSGVASGSRSPGRWLSEALDSPLARWTLLEPRMARIAVGAEVFEPSGAMAIVTTYALFESADHRADEDTVFETLTKMRTARGLAPPRRAPKDEALRTALSKVSMNALSSPAALNEALEQVAGEQRQAVRGWVVETGTLQQLPLDKTLLAPGPLEVEVGVTHHRIPGGAWGQYAVLFVILGDSVPSVTARGNGPTRSL
jgi:hypothetical protein